jgi:tellurite methyltransferase
VANSFDDAYKNEACYWRLTSNRFVREFLDYKHSGKILDLGVSEGRNALFLAQNGFDVTGVDLSEAGINKFEALARQLGVPTGSGGNLEIFDSFYEPLISNGPLPS